jgi:hypothetical protein
MSLFWEAMRGWAGALRYVVVIRCNDLLMRCLADIGLRGNILASIVSMYWNALMITKLAGRVGQALDSTRGLKQYTWFEAVHVV